MTDQSEAADTDPFVDPDDYRPGTPLLTRLRVLFLVGGFLAAIGGTYAVGHWQGWW